MRKKQLPRKAYEIIREMLLSGHDVDEVHSYMKRMYPHASRVHVNRQRHVLKGKGYPVMDERRKNDEIITTELPSGKIILDNQIPTPALTASDFEDIKDKADYEYEKITGVRPKVFSRQAIKQNPVKNNVLPPTGVEHWQFQSIKFTTRNGDTVEIHLTSQSMRDIVSNLLR